MNRPREIEDVVPHTDDAIVEIHWQEKQKHKKIHNGLIVLVDSNQSEIVCLSLRQVLVQ